MNEKVSFINEWRSGCWPMSELCTAFGISRTLGYKYLDRYESEGLAGLLERSKAPFSSPNKTPGHIEKAIITLRKQHCRWGPEKLKTVLSERSPGVPWPAESTIALILKRNNLMKPRHRRRKIECVFPIFDPKNPNDVWSADFKGKFRLGNGKYCSPLTIADSYSRFLFSAEGLEYADYIHSRPIFERVFAEYGLPLQLHTDNGAPFGNVSAIARLTHLAVWFLELGIEPVYSDPGHPEQNGRHERMHRELKAEATKPPAYGFAVQQRKLNAFREEYNEVRPHHALGNLPPVRIHAPSPRPYSDCVLPWDYPYDFKVFKVCRNGAIRWGSHNWIMVSTTLIGKLIGLEELGYNIYRVFFRQKLLGYLDASTLRIQDDQGRVIRS
ncbi:MAG: IS481 family transposase [Thermodesulfovibrionales bacterium]